MFGIFKPCFCGVTDDSIKHDWMSRYCDLCGSVSSLYGVSKRLLVVYDVATLSWLFYGGNKHDNVYPSFNCVKGGVLLRRNAKPEGVRKFLASFSVLAASVKLFDDRSDNPGLTSDLKAKFAEKAYNDALLHAEETGFNAAEIRGELSNQSALEARRESDLILASEPTARCYGKAARIIASHTDDSSISAQDAESIGEYVGRWVHIIDAFRDRTEDAASQHYNPFLCANSGAISINDAADKGRLFQALEYLKPQVEATIGRLPSAFKSRWECVMRNLVNYTGLSGRDRLFVWCICPCMGGHVAATGEEVNQGCCKCCVWSCLCCCVAAAACQR